MTILDALLGHHRDYLQEAATLSSLSDSKPLLVLSGFLLD
jgi:hypothetical protein